MLVIKPFVNYTNIDDEIWIQNIGWGRNNIYLYLTTKFILVPLVVISEYTLDATFEI